MSYACSFIGEITLDHQLYSMVIYFSASRFEYWLLGKFLNINPELGLTTDGQCGFTHKQILQMWGSPENLNTINSFTKKLKGLDLSFEEIALLRGIVVLSRGMLYM